MKIFLGHTSSHKILARLETLGWGRFWCYHNQFNPFPGEQWGLDNGAYAAWQNDTPWDAAAFIDKAQRAAEMDGCVLAVLPDMVGQGERSLDFSLEWLAKLPKLPWYLAVQDGMELQPLWGRLLDNLDGIDGLFLGGTKRFKLTAMNWRMTADMMGKRLHYARCSTPAVLQHAMNCNVDSVDSCFPLWTKERLAIFEKVISGEAPQMQLAEEWGYRNDPSLLFNSKQTLAEERASGKRNPLRKDSRSV